MGSENMNIRLLIDQERTRICRLITVLYSLIGVLAVISIVLNMYRLSFSRNTDSFSLLVAFVQIFSQLTIIGVSVWYIVYLSKPRHAIEAAVNFLTARKHMFSVESFYFPMEYIRSVVTHYPYSLIHKRMSLIRGVFFGGAAFIGIFGIAAFVNIFLDVNQSSGELGQVILVLMIFLLLIIVSGVGGFLYFAIVAWNKYYMKQFARKQVYYWVIKNFYPELCDNTIPQTLLPTNGRVDPMWPIYDNRPTYDNAHYR
jgi:hypothetical protein